MLMNEVEGYEVDLRCSQCTPHFPVVFVEHRFSAPRLRPRHLQDCLLVCVSFPRFGRAILHSDVFEFYALHIFFRPVDYILSHLTPSTSRICKLQRRRGPVIVRVVQRASSRIRRFSKVKEHARGKDRWHTGIDDVCSAGSRDKLCNTDLWTIDITGGRPLKYG